jgi:hypothetical protein
VHLLNEVAEHPLGHVEVGDHAVLERPDRHDIARRAADHPLGLDAHRDHLAGVRIERDHARLVENDPPAAHVDQGVSRAEVDRQVTAEERQRIAHRVGNPSDQI